MPYGAPQICKNINGQHPSYYKKCSKENVNFKNPTLCELFYEFVLYSNYRWYFHLVYLFFFFFIWVTTKLCRRLWRGGHERVSVFLGVLRWLAGSLSTKIWTHGSHRDPSAPLAYFLFLITYIVGGRGRAGISLSQQGICFGPLDTLIVL